MDAVLAPATPSTRQRIAAKAVAAYYFYQVRDEEGLGTDVYRCRVCGVNRKRPTTAGYSNLYSHVATKHEGFEDVMAALPAGQTGLVLSHVGGRVLDAFRWLEWVVMCDVPFCAVDAKATRSMVKYEPICSKTLVKYIGLLASEVERRIAASLPEAFGVMFDGWTMNSDHYVGAFITYDGKEILFAMSPLVDDEREDLTADSHRDHLSTNLGYFGRSLANVRYLVGDNCSVNGRLARLIGVPLVGCASHRLNLAAKGIYEDLEPALHKVQRLMVRLRGLKDSAQLRAAQELRGAKRLRPVLRQETRWDSTYRMLERYFLLLPDLDPAANYELPTAHENRKLKSVCEDLAPVAEVSRFLQRERTTMAQVRTLFDALIESSPSTAGYLSATAPIVKFPAFEAACVKVGRGEALTRADERVLEAFVASAATARPTAPARPTKKPRSEFIERALTPKATGG